MGTYGKRLEGVSLFAFGSSNHPFMVYSDWLTPGLGPVTRTGTRKLACMILCRTFHITPELGPVNSRMGFKPIFQDLKLSPVISCNWFLTTFTIFNTSSALNMAPTCRKIKTFRRKKRERKESHKLFMFYLMYEFSTIHRDYWVHPINIERPHKGEFHTHYTDLRHYEDRFFEYYRMTPVQFDYVLEKNSSAHKKKRHTLQRSCVSRGETSNNNYVSFICS